MVIKLKYKIICFLILFILIALPVFNEERIFAIKNESIKNEAIYLPIIMYHEIKTFNVGKDVITPHEFENDLKFLSENQYSTITMAQLYDYVYNDIELPLKPIILSFDDGYLNNYKYAFPLLKKYNMKIVLSIIGKNTDDFTNIPDDNIDYSHVTWDHLNEMLASGYVEVQNHSYNLHSIKKGRYGCKQKSSETLSQYEQIMKDDIGRFQDQITYMTGITPNTFTYPYGASSKDTDAILKEMGFIGTLSCRYGINIITKDPNKLFGLKRICRAHRYNIERLIKEGMETLKFIKKKK
jgi:peptidoglycan/xylan/chitin deacetylase (PgdA/CDA1 family)